MRSEQPNPNERFINCNNCSGLLDVERERYEKFVQRFKSILVIIVHYTYSVFGAQFLGSWIRRKCFKKF